MAYIKTVQELIDVLSSLSEEQKQMPVRIEDDCFEQYIEYVEEYDDDGTMLISIQSQNAMARCKAKLLWPSGEEVE